MSLISGKVVNKHGKPLHNVKIYIKYKLFEDLYTAYTDENGNYRMEIENKKYPYFCAVKEYKENNLEFWCQDIDLKENLIINATIDKLEVYGLKIFKVDGAYPGLMVYFRPMSLVNHLKGLSDLFPDIDKFEATINDENVEIYVKNQVEEFVGNGKKVKAYLLHMALPKKVLKENKNYLLLQITDKNGNVGQAGSFFKFFK